MSVSRQSRYYGLPTFSHAGRLTLAQRFAPRPDETEPFILHRLGATETIDQLALRYYGRQDLWWRIADANPNKFPLDWEPGDLVRIPSDTRVTRVP